MKNIIQFHVWKEKNCYVAQGVNLSVVTQAKTLDELTKNIKEAVALHLEGEDFSEFNLSSKPSVLLNYELEDSVYA